MTAKRGQPRRYDEKKTAHIFVDITPTGKLALDQKIYQYDARLSRSEFLELLGRGGNIDVIRFCKVFFNIDLS